VLPRLRRAAYALPVNVAASVSRCASSRDSFGCGPRAVGSYHCIKLQRSRSMWESGRQPLRGMRCDNEKRRASRRRVLKGAFIAYNDRRCTLPCAVRDIFDKVKCPGRREKNGWRREFFNRRRSLECW